MISARKVVDSEIPWHLHCQGVKPAIAPALFFFVSFLSLFCTLGGDVAQLVRASNRHAADVGSIPRCGKGFFFQSQLSVQTLLHVSVPPPPPLRANACINICARVKDLVVYVRVRWIMETPKHPACTGGWVARLCRSWLSPRKATRISHGRNPIGTIQWQKVWFF